MQLINLTTYKINGQLDAKNIAIDVDDLTTPIRLSAASKSYFTARSKASITEPNSVVKTDYQCDDSLASIHAQSAKILSLTVKSRRGISKNNETYLFNSSKISDKFVAIGSDTQFYYVEDGDPEVVEYVVDETISQIIAHQADVHAQESFPVAASDETTAVAAGTSLISWRMPYDFTLTEVKGSLNSGTGTGTFTVDVKNNGVSVFSTLMTFDAGETTTQTATVPSAIDNAALLNDDIITVDVTDDGDGTATGLKVYLIGNQ